MCKERLRMRASPRTPSAQFFGASDHGMAVAAIDETLCRNE